METPRASDTRSRVFQGAVDLERSWKLNSGPKKVDCTRHPGVEAAWICTECRFALCPKCAAGTVIQMRPVVRCTRCGGEAKILAVPHQVTPFWKVLPTFVLWMFSPRSLISLLFAALAMWGLTQIPAAGGPLAAVFATGYLYLTIRDGARGRMQLPWPRHIADQLLDLLFGAGQIAAATAPLWLPITLYLQLRYGWQALAARPTAPLFDPVLVPLTVLGALYLPAAQIQALLGESLLSLLNPVATVKSVRQIQKPYLALAGLWTVLMAGNVYLVAALIALAAKVHVPVVTPVMLNVVGLLIPLVAAFTVGRFVLQYGNLFGVAPSGDFFLAERTVE